MTCDEQVCHVIHSECVKIQFPLHREKPDTAISTVVIRVFDVCIPKFICVIKDMCEGIVLR